MLLEAKGLQMLPLALYLPTIIDLSLFLFSFFSPLSVLLSLLAPPQLKFSLHIFLYVYFFPQRCGQETPMALRVRKEVKSTGLRLASSSEKSVSPWRFFSSFYDCISLPLLSLFMLLSCLFIHAHSQISSFKDCKRLPSANELI